MENDKIQDLLDNKSSADGIEDARFPVTILFSDIKGSTSYFEKYGDVAGMAMLERHNSLLFPQIQKNAGRVVKTIGDSIMAAFENCESAVRAAVEMQRALAEDRNVRVAQEHIHIRVGLHFGPGLLKGDDIYGDVVNAAARLQKQAQPGQILITDVLLDSAKAAGFQCAALGKAEMRGKDEPIDVFAVAWSDSASEQLFTELQERFDAKLKEQKSQFDELEEEYEQSREQWRAERRKMSAQIEQLEDTIQGLRHRAQSQTSHESHSEIRFQLQEAVRAKENVERQLSAAEGRWQAERNNLKAQIATMQASVIEAMERSNNPARNNIIIREQVEARLAEAKRAWDVESHAERRRWTAEIDRLKKLPGVPNERKEAARVALLQKLGKLPPDKTSTAPRSAEQLRQDLEQSKRERDAERELLVQKMKHLESQLSRSQDNLRADVFQELHAQFEPKLAEANSERQRLHFEVQALAAELKDERERMSASIQDLERAVKNAQIAARVQATAELEGRFEVKLNEATRSKSRAERKLQDISEELETERRRAKRQIAHLEEQLKEAREAAFKANRQFRN